MLDANKIISFAVAFQVIVQGCKNILVQGLPFFYSINDSLNTIIMGGALLFYIFALFASRGNLTPKDTIGVLAFVALTFFFTYLFFPKNFIFIEPTILRTLISCFFTFFLVSKLTSFVYLHKYLTRGSLLITFCGIVYAMIISSVGHTTTSEWSSYSMTMSNVMLLSVIWQLNGFFERKKIVLLVAAILGAAIIFIYGSRNPLLAIVAFVSIKIIFNSGGNRKSASLAIRVFFLTIVLVFIAYFKIIISFIANTLDDFGLGSRTIYYFLNSDTEDITTGRSDIHGSLWNLVFNNPLGLGIAGDEANIGEQAHSLYLSIFITYGLFVGIIVLLYLLFQTIKGLRKTSGLNHDIIIIYFCIVFPRSFTGGDIWINDYLWLFLALIISSSFQKRINKVNKVLYKTNGYKKNIKCYKP